MIVDMGGPLRKDETRVNQKTQGRTYWSILKKRGRIRKYKLKSETEFAGVSTLMVLEVAALSGLSYLF